MEYGYGQQGQHGHGTTGRVDQYDNPVVGVGQNTIENWFA
jgi:hypothetical protein